jgi:hypothetical protein
MKLNLTPVRGTRKTEHVDSTCSVLNIGRGSPAEPLRIGTVNTPFVPAEQLPVDRWEALGVPWVCGE